MEAPGPAVLVACGGGAEVEAMWPQFTALEINVACPPPHPLKKKKGYPKRDSSENRKGGLRDPF